MLPDGLFKALMAKPEDEAGTGILLRQADRSEHEAEELEPDALVTTIFEVTGNRMQPTQTFGLGGKFSQEVCDVGWQFGQAARRRPIGKHKVGPQILQHFHQVTLAAAVKATDPHAGLFGLVEMIEVGSEDAVQTCGVLPVADEIRQFKSQRLQFGIGQVGGDFCHPLIQQSILIGIFVVDLAKLHGRPSPSSARMGTAR